jgi:3'(2'), 5'-bisphosphate nucleotidase/myo-inositol-1(or 4)-monophosphatase
MLEHLAAIVRDVGREVLALRGTAKADGVWQGSQLKAEADRVAHVVLCQRLGKLAPDLPVISEEDESSLADRPRQRYFLVDPIDGTASFSAGFPGFVTQVAVMEADRPVMGAIYAPAFDHLYLAERHNGATLNGGRLATAGDTRGPVLIDNYPEPRGVAADAYRALGCSRYIECGSIALKICRVADGSADLFIKDVTVRDWDIAPGHLVLEEAGGFFCGTDGAIVRYDGNHEKPGLVAAGRATTARAAADWLADRKGRR